MNTSIIRKRKNESPSGVAALISELVQGLVADPAAVAVDRTDIGNMAVLRIRVAKSDVCRVVGAEGRHFRALEAIAAALLEKIGLESHLVLDEENASASSHRQDQRAGMNRVLVVFNHVVRALVSQPEAVRCDLKKFGSTYILPITVAAADRATLHGNRTAEFKHGTDGVVIGSLKNLFDAIAKQAGCYLRISLVDSTV